MNLHEVKPICGALDDSETPREMHIILFFCQMQLWLSVQKNPMPAFEAWQHLERRLAEQNSNPLFN